MTIDLKRMQGEFGFVLKVLLISLIGAIAIKYIAPYLAISASTGGVLVSVFLPSTVIGIVLGWRSLQEKSH
ncbi:MAG: hypothetical protein SFY66_01350 [Oculatellaceae cyanobacterium bins.114]|nr:hypothetical protein [Oculatellaceae cyanobacterium bins.114]